MHKKRQFVNRSVWWMCVQDDERPMLDVLDQASPVVLESFTHVLSDSVSHS